MQLIHIYPGKRDYKVVKSCEEGLKRKLWDITELHHPVTYNNPEGAFKATRVLCVELKGGRRAYALKLPIFNGMYYNTNWYA